MEKKKNLLILSWKQWLLCYAASLALGGMVWFGTGNTWLAFGAIMASTAAFVFYLSGQKIKAERTTAQPDPSTLSRQQRRELDRKNNKK